MFLLLSLGLVGLNLSSTTTSAVSSSASDDVLDLCEVIPEMELAASYEQNCRNDKIPMIVQMYLRRKKPSREGRIVNVEGSRRNSPYRPTSYNSGPSSNYYRSDEYYDDYDEDDYEDDYYDVEAEYHYYYDGDDDGYGFFDMLYEFFD